MEDADVRSAPLLSKTQVSCADGLVRGQEGNAHRRCVRREALASREDHLADGRIPAVGSHEGSVDESVSAQILLPG